MNKIKKLKKLPVFKNEDEEFEFWQKADSTDYFDWSKAKRGLMFPNLKLTSKLVTFRLPSGLLDVIKIEVHKRDMPY